ncbi:MAG: tRNA epoxyqueuosine(34) reductase QueG [Microscillaceae bacterium]|nr:tRNA epoxyqueuosine(34) reductase QueG [Microscillaceae bacterium]MDW8461733.1 tRNA epoxyqueuosine(34) reductase QueG [Cytophagales bacterium]
MNFAKRQHYTQLVKQKAYELGFNFCGIAKAEFLEEEAPRLEKWLREGKHGQMQYMENHFDKRLNPQLLVEGAKSVISLLLNYFPKQVLSCENNYKISKYAYGKDYHLVIKDKLKKLLAFMKEQIGQINGRAFVDSAPVMDKVWAKKSGLGWIGKHTNLINRKIGSFFFIAELIVDIELIYDTPIQDYCGTCTRCIDACPTQAITQPYGLDASKCISYFTIELKENMPIPSEFEGKFENWIFGCDICQDICPWNRFALPHQVQEFEILQGLKTMRKKEWQEITEETFQQVFKHSPLKRAKLKGLQRNIAFVEKKG